MSKTKYVPTSKVISVACKCCVLTFSCTCHDYTIKNNMCKHIHAVRLNMENKKDVKNKTIRYFKSTRREMRYVRKCYLFNHLLVNPKKVLLIKCNNCITCSCLKQAH